MKMGEWHVKMGEWHVSGRSEKNDKKEDGWLL